MLAILDYEAGNQTSVLRGCAFQGINAVITADTNVLASADGVIFPGVGAAGQAMGLLKDRKLDVLLKNLVADGKPLLGVCLGCQILLDKSEENNTDMLGIVPGDCVRFSPDLKDEDNTPITIPHMGWNSIIKKQKSPLLEGIPDTAEFYFVHSYYTLPAPDMVIATTRHGLEFCSIFGRDGLWAVQFHPEKSGSYGLAILSNFTAYCLANKQ